MPLAKSHLKELLKQIPEFDESELPTLEDKKAFVAAQLEGTQKAAYRSLVDVEIAKEFAKSKDEKYMETARARLEEAAGTLRVYKPTLKVLNAVAEELAKTKE